MEHKDEFTVYFTPPTLLSILLEQKHFQGVSIKGLEALWNNFNVENHVTAHNHHKHYYLRQYWQNQEQ